MKDNLDDNIRDKLVAASRGAVSFVPLVGGPLGELITHVIPQLRQDRIVSYLRQLSEKVETLEKLVADEALSDVEKIDLVEAGGYEAARSTTEKRITEIVELVFNGLKHEAADIVRRKRLLDILTQIDDDEVLMLDAYGQTYEGHRPDAWKNVDRPTPAHLQSTVSEIDQEALYELGRERLLRLGLLKQRFGSVKKGEYPEFDAKAGGFKGRVEISYLGRMLRSEMGLSTAAD